MENKIIKIISITALWLIFAFNIVQAAPLLQKQSADDANDLATNMAKEGGLEAVSIGTTVSTIIRGFLSILGIIFIILIIIAGWKYLNARGNEEKVNQAIDSIRQAIIGLIIVMGAYAITYFVFKNLPGDVGTGTSNGQNSSPNIYPN